jgi:beta-galactosidase
MRSILSIIALFSCCTLAAQEYIPTYGRELPRGEVIAYPTAQEAAAASAGDTRYFTRLADWTQKDNVFSTEFTVRMDQPAGILPFGMGFGRLRSARERQNRGL